MQYPLLGDLKNRPVPVDDGSNCWVLYDARRFCCGMRMRENAGD